MLSPTYAPDRECFIFYLLHSFHGTVDDYVSTQDVGPRVTSKLRPNTRLRNTHADGWQPEEAISLAHSVGGLGISRLATQLSPIDCPRCWDVAGGKYGILGACSTVGVLIHDDEDVSFEQDVNPRVHEDVPALRASANNDIRK